MPGTAATEAQAQIPANLHLHQDWLNLVHYRPNRIRSGYTSEADDAAFFISPEGKTSPRAELEATVAALAAPGTGDDHARCRFPARDRWLRSQLALPDTPADCPAFSQWFDTLNAETVTLVFAASYLNSPSSMFGHTFIRLDPPSDAEDTDLLLANTISYAADAEEHDNELLFAYRGIFGGYPGITSVRPYYEMIRLYSDIENRDLWEYQLNLTPDETWQLLAHAWEVQDKNFDYYFFDENCAYRLLALIDVARPGTQLLDEVFTHAIPSDTVRWVVARDLVADVHYRPSAATVVAHYIQQLPAEQRKLAHALAYGRLTPDSPTMQALSPREQADLLDAAYDYLRYQAMAGKLFREQAAPTSHQLLMARSRLREPPALEQPPVPAIRDDQGHDTFRLTLAGGRDGDRNYGALTLRPAYHDVLDPPDGYRPGAQLQFLRLDARFYTDTDDLQLEQLTGVEIRSLSPRDRFFQPLSWQVGFGARRSEIASGKRLLTPYLEGGAGGSWMLPGGIQAFSVLTADLEIAKGLAKGYDIAPGADLGLLYQHQRLSLMAGAKTKFWLADGEEREDTGYLGINTHLHRAVSLGGQLTRSHYFDRYETRWQLGLNLYF
ncbi:MAG: DUF4105 domain-containing protein [Marinobacter sp.]|nr:DUF4105 domain-containing protein [Marinobacter sp.]